MSRWLDRSAQNLNAQNRGITAYKSIPLDQVLYRIDAPFALSGGEVEQRYFLLLVAIAQLIQDYRSGLVLHSDPTFSKACRSLYAHEGFEHYLRIVDQHQPSFMPFLSMSQRDVGQSLEKIAEVMGYERLPAYVMLIDSYLSITRAISVPSSLRILEELVKASAEDVHAMLDGKFSEIEQNMMMRRISPERGSNEERAFHMMYDVISQLVRTFENIMPREGHNFQTSLTAGTDHHELVVLELPVASKIAQAYIACELQALQKRIDIQDGVALIINDLMLDNESDLVRQLRVGIGNMILGLVSDNLPAMIGNDEDANILLSRVKRAVLFRHANYVTAQKMTEYSPTYDKMVVETSYGSGTSGTFFNRTHNQGVNRNVRYSENKRVIEANDLMNLVHDQAFILDFTVGRNVMFTNSIQL